MKFNYTLGLIIFWSSEYENSVKNDLAKVAQGKTHSDNPL